MGHVVVGFEWCWWGDGGGGGLVFRAACLW